MDSMPVEDRNTPVRPPRIDLPFRKGPSDPGEWAYEHRVGLCVTVIAYLLAAIVFVSAKIVIGGRIQPEIVYVDLVQELPIPEIPEEDKKLHPIDDFSQVGNRVSNENASAGGGGSGGGLNASLRDDRGASAQSIYDEASAVQQRSAANRRAYEQGLGEEQAMSERRPSSNVGAQRSGDVKTQGRVAVSFSLSNPIRYSDELFIPAYMCEAGGEIIVSITVNRNGDVIAASPRKASASVDECITTTAVNAALQSRFNVDPRAPDKQQGTITYIFMPQ